MRVVRHSLVALVAMLWVCGISIAQDKEQEPSEEEIRLLAAQVAKAELEVQKAQADLAEQLSKESNVKGEVKVGEKAGIIEASVLAAQALGPIGDKIRCRLKPLGEEGAKKLVLISGDESADTSRWELFNFKASYLTSELHKIKSDFELLELSADKSTTFIVDTASQEVFSRKSQKAPGALADDNASKLLVMDGGFTAATAVLGGLSRLFSYGNTDYDVRGVDVSKDNDLLIAAIASSGGEPKFYLPTRLTKQGAAEAVYEVVDKLGRLGTDVSDLTAVAEKRAEALKKEIKKIGDAGGNVAALTAKLEETMAIIGRAKSGLSQYENFMKSLLAVESVAPMPLATVVSQKALSDTLGEDGYAVFVKVVSSGGGSFTKKNMWTFLGAMPFFVSGGSVVSYIAVSRADGSIGSSGAIAFQCGYRKASKVASEKIMLTCVAEDPPKSPKSQSAPEMPCQ